MASSVDNTILPSVNEDERGERDIGGEDDEPFTLEQKVRLVLDTRPSVVAGLGRMPFAEGEQSMSLSRTDAKRKTLPARKASANSLRGLSRRRRSSSLRDTTRFVEFRRGSSPQNTEDVIIDNLESGDELPEIPPELTRGHSLRKSSIHLRHKLIARLELLLLYY